MTSKTRIYLIRHGQVIGHDQPRYNGQTDVSLTEYGLQQYHRLREYFSSIPISACYTSDLTRCTMERRLSPASKALHLNNGLN